ncbi:MAG: type 1 glutamine amidotransferase [Rubellimicrobium sp.]|nr:type 1 glutamine amidotransferase [Rubellimicrobium sp.]
MLIGILQTGRAPDALQPDHGDYPDLFQRLLGGRDFTFRTYAVLDGVLPDDPHECDGWLITGSRHATYEDHPWIPRLESFIRRTHAADVPMVGICFGHQIIAQAMGGKVAKHPGGWAVGRTEYDWGGEKVALNAWHQDQVVARPDGAELIATNDFCENAALLYGDRMLTMQAHPEFTRSFAADIIEKRGRGLVPDPLLDAALERAGQGTDSPEVADRIERFLKTRQVA